MTADAIDFTRWPDGHPARLAALAVSEGLCFECGARLAPLPDDEREWFIASGRCPDCGSEVRMDDRTLEITPGNP